jgi:hypothetical protein
MTKLILLVPTVGKRAGDEIDVKDDEDVQRLVDSGSACRKADAKPAKG